MYLLSLRYRFIVCFLNSFLNYLIKLRTADSLLDSFGWGTSFAYILYNLVCELFSIFYLQTDETSKILTLITYNYHLRDDWQVCYDLVLNEERRNILSSSCNDKFLDTASNVDIVFGINSTLISRMYKTFAIYCGFVSLVIFVIAHES